MKRLSPLALLLLVLLPSLSRGDVSATAPPLRNGSDAAKPTTLGNGASYWSTDAHGLYLGAGGVPVRVNPPLTLSAIEAALGFAPLDSALLQSGTATGQTLRWDGSKWAKSSNLTNDGSVITLNGTVYATITGGFKGGQAQADYFTDAANTKGYWDTGISGVNWLNVNRVPGNANVAIQAAAGQTAPTLEGLDSTGGTTWSFSGVDGTPDFPGTGGSSLRVGAGSIASSGAATALGHGAVVTGLAGVGVGYNLSNAGDWSFAEGYGATIPAGISGSMAMGADSLVTASHQLVMGGTGTAGYLADGYFGNGVTNSAPQPFTIHATGGAGADVAGADIIIAGGTGTGNALPGAVVIKAATAGASGSTAQALGEVGRFSAAGLDVSGSLRAAGSVDVAGSGTVAPLGGGSVVLLGTGTHFLTEVRPGDTLTGSGGSRPCRVVSVQSDTQLTLELDAGVVIPGAYTLTPPIVRAVQSNGSPGVTLSADGRFGIGTNTPNANLDVVGTALFSATAGTSASFVPGVGGNGTNLELRQLAPGSSAIKLFSYSGQPGWAVGMGTTDSFDLTRVNTAGTAFVGSPLFRLTTDGLLGVNTTSPLAQFHVVGSDPAKPVARFDMAAGQTGNGIELNSSTGTGGDVFRVDSGSNLFIAGGITSGGRVTGTSWYFYDFSVGLYNPSAIGDSGNALAVVASNGTTLRQVQASSLLIGPSVSSSKATIGTDGNITAPGYSAACRTVSADDTATLADTNLFLNGAFAETLPTTGVPVGRRFTIKDISASAASLTNTIDGTAGYSLPAGAAVTVVWGGSAYYAISKY